LRGAAYAILGLHHYLELYPGALDIRKMLQQLAGFVMQHYWDQHAGEWLWFEPVLTYDNGIIPAALWLASYRMDSPEMRQVAEITTGFLFRWCQREGHVSLVGCEGWHGMGRSEKAHFDQQPVDACGLVLLAKTAYRLTGDPEYLYQMQMAFEWFLGRNDLGTSLYDVTTGGCYDGLTPYGPNLNEGAESTLSFLLALLAVTEIALEEEQDRAWSVSPDTSLLRKQVVSPHPFTHWPGPKR